MKKFELTSTSIEWMGTTLYQIRALKSFYNVKAGDMGGFVEKEDNLSQKDSAWIYNNAYVSDNARVLDDARIFGNAKIFDNARVRNKVSVCDNARIYDYARILNNAKILGNAHVCGDTHVSGYMKLTGNAYVLSDDHIVCVYPIGSEDGTLTMYTTKTGIDVTRGCFHGTLEEFEMAVKETHGDNKYAQQYHMLIELAKLRFSDYLCKLKAA